VFVNICTPCWYLHTLDDIFTVISPHTFMYVLNKRICVSYVITLRVFFSKIPLCVFQVTGILPTQCLLLYVIMLICSKVINYLAIKKET
jgi:hypothetical protein